VQRSSPKSYRRKWRQCGSHKSSVSFPIANCLLVVQLPFLHEDVKSCSRGPPSGGVPRAPVVRVHDSSDSGQEPRVCVVDERGVVVDWVAHHI
jgi:hypothetical protein